MVLAIPAASACVVIILQVYKDLTEVQPLKQGCVSVAPRVDPVRPMCVSRLKLKGYL